MNRKVFYKVLYMYFALISPQTIYPQWTSISTSLPDNIYISAIVLSGSKIFVGTSRSGVYFSSDAGNTWGSRNGGLSSNSLRVASLYEDGSNLFMGTENDGPFRSTDEGMNWMRIDSGLSLINGTYLGSAFYFHRVGQKLYMAESSGIYFSTNDGQVWNSTGGKGAWSLVSNSLYLFEGTANSGVYRYPLIGGTWTAVNVGLPANAEIDAMLLYDQTLTVSVWPHDIYRSTNNGDNWTKLLPGIVESTSIDIYCFLLDNGILYAGTMAMFDSHSGIYRSTDFGSTWSVIDSGMSHSLSIYSLAIDSNYLYAGSDSGKVWRRSRLDFATSIRNCEQAINDFTLHQNYPNPFNPATIISFDLPCKTYVSLKVYNMLGREVSVLISKELPAGTYSQQWIAKGLTSGVYFYRLQTGSFNETKKLVLLR